MTMRKGGLTKTAMRLGVKKVEPKAVATEKAGVEVQAGLTTKFTKKLIEAY
jgi:hypothetical protein